MRGPTRSADKWKECLKNRINQIRCRARKSMLEWNHRSVHSKKRSQVDKPGNLETDDKHIAEVNDITQSHMDEQSTNDNYKRFIKEEIPLDLEVDKAGNLETDDTHIAEVNYITQSHMDEQSFNDNYKGIIKEEIPVDLESRVSDHSFAWLDMDTSSRHSNNCVNRESSHITQDQLKIFIALVKQYCDDDSDTKLNIDVWSSIAEALNTVDGSIQRSAEEWKERLVEWKNQVSTTADGSEGTDVAKRLTESDQEALQLLKRMLIVKPVLHITEIHNLQTSEFQQSVLATNFKQELTHDNYSDTLPAVSDNEDVKVEDNIMNRNCLHRDDTNSPISANSANSNLNPSPPHSSAETLTTDFMDLVRESITKREEREERAIVQQKLLTNALELLNKNLETMTTAIAKFNEKLDKL